MTWHKRDKIMTSLVKALPAPATKTSEDLYLSLLDAIVGQQLSTKAADSIFLRFRALFKDKYPDAKKLLKLSDEKLRGVGLSNAKVNYVRNIAEHHIKQPITSERLSQLGDDEIIAELTAIKGVGLWTVQMMLMFAMGRPDVFAVGDLIIRKMMVEHYKVTETGAAQIKRLHEIAAHWAPQRTLACRYLWASRDLVKKSKSC